MTIKDVTQMSTMRKKSQFCRKGEAMNARARKAARDGRDATLQKHMPPGSNYHASRQRKGKVLPAQILEEASELAEDF